tara:strand:+ start:285 stop:569 length:285 start_codon:yes stop_codon:yes gene_type:complete
MEELNEETKFQISIKTLIAIGVALSTLIAFYYSIQSEIEEAKLLPEPEISRMEYDMKDEMIRNSILNTEDKVNSNGDKLDKIEERLYKIKTKDD